MMKSRVFRGTTITGLKLVKDYSGKCVKNGRSRTYGFSGSRVFVRGGCDADFEIQFTGTYVPEVTTTSTSTSTVDLSLPQVMPPQIQVFPPQITTSTVTQTIQVLQYRLSTSKVFQGITITGLRLVNDYSNKCVKNVNYGFSGSEVFVRGGCDADFEIQYSGTLIAPQITTSTTSTSTNVQTVGGKACPNLAQLQQLQLQLTTRGNTGNNCRRVGVGRWNQPQCMKQCEQHALCNTIYFRAGVKCILYRCVKKTARRLRNANLFKMTASKMWMPSGDEEINDEDLDEQENPKEELSDEETTNDEKNVETTNDVKETKDEETKKEDQEETAKAEVKQDD